MVTRLTDRKRHEPPLSTTELLANVSLFADLQPEDLAEIALAVRHRTAKRGAVLLSQDAIGETAFILLRGEVHIVAVSSDGRELLLARVAPGEIFGEMALLDEEPRSASAIAVRDCEVLVVSRLELLQQLRRHPEIMLRLLRSLTRRLRKADLQINAFAFSDVACRLAGELLLLGEAAGDNVIAVDQQQLANQIGAARQTVSRILNDWRRRGWIDTRRGGVRILDRTQLGRLEPA